VLDGRAVVHLAAGLDDDALLALVAEHAPVKVAIDAPFGWPVPFLDAMRAQRDRTAWPVPPGEHGRRAPLERRATDRWVAQRTGKVPLSVSTDRIAYCAMRCAALLTALGERDRTGRGRCVEVYPAAALQLWGLDDGRTSYKRGAGAPAARAAIAERLASAVDLAAHRDACAACDDVLDAVVCALVARAAADGLTDAPPPEHAEDAAVEGWIHLPRAGSFDRLAR